jgi:hypothetical protein
VFEVPAYPERGEVGDFGEPDFGEKPASLLSNTDFKIPYPVGYLKIVPVSPQCSGV